MAGWHESFAKPRASAVECVCVVCAQPFWLPPSKASRYKTCSEACRVIQKAADRLSQERQCETCGCTYYRATAKSRSNRFCSQACNTAKIEAINSPAATENRLAAMRAIRAKGEWTILTGESHPNWLGGHDAYMKRITENGKRLEWQRRYYRANPDKVRDFRSNRRRRKLGKLPQGTVAKIRVAQRGKCAICRKSIFAKSHLDHIMPLALGGLHEPRNLQLLCPPCNQHKAAKHPIDHMRELGRLL